MGSPSATPRRIVCQIAERIERFPLKLTLLTIVLCLYFQESYPFSHFPMYASLGDRTRFYYVTDESGHPLSFVDEFRLSSTFYKKMHDETHDSMWAAEAMRLGENASEEDWLRIESRAGEVSLAFLRDRMPAEARSDGHLQLWRVDVLLIDGELRRGLRKLAEIPLDDSTL